MNNIYSTAHRLMWKWLAENPDCEKADWPGWADNGGVYAGQENDCFACGYAEKQCYENHVDSKGTHACDYCPLDAELMQRCEGRDSLWFKWYYAASDNENPDYSERIALANKIKDAWRA